jgi:hypothetical protein
MSPEASDTMLGEARVIREADAQWLAMVIEAVRMRHVSAHRAPEMPAADSVSMDENGEALYVG